MRVIAQTANFYVVDDDEGSLCLNLRKDVIQRDDFVEDCVGELADIVIEKWGLITWLHTRYPEKRVKTGKAMTCAFCLTCDTHCKGCPIAEAGYRGCNNTEYLNYNFAPGYETAQAELDFLASIIANKYDDVCDWCGLPINTYVEVDSIVLCSVCANADCGESRIPTEL